jgi:broad specificity phosphatase PhoE
VTTPFPLYANPLFYLVRHGFTEENEEGQFRGIEDYPLNEDGLEAADEIAHWLSFRPIFAVYSSPVLRAVQTAMKITPDFDRNPGLMCWNIGTFSGKSKRKYGPLLQEYIDTPDRIVPGGESLNQFRSTVERTINNYLTQAMYQSPLVLITHSSFIRCASSILRPDEYSFDTGDIVEPGGIISVDMGNQGVVNFIPVLGEVISGEMGTS